MPLIPIYAAPGINKSTTDYSAGQQTGYAATYSQGRAAHGRYVDCDKTRFVAGFPEKIGGWMDAVTALCVGIPRRLQAWRDNVGNPQLAIGTQSHLYVFNGTTLTDITPLRTISTGTLSSPFTTTNGSFIVAVADSSQKLQNGDHVFLSAATAVGGVLVDGWYTVAARSGSGYDITVTTAATSGAGPGGGTTQFSYPRVTLTNPFTTTSGSATVLVDHTAHGATTGDYVTYSGATAVAGLTLNGEYQLTVVDANSYDIAASALANASTTGGGSVSVMYDITIQQAALSGASPVVYGVGVYGTGPYGYSAYAVSTFDSGWSLAAYGDQMLANPIGGTIYIYDPVQGGRAYPMLDAPASVQAMFVTPERFVFALGITDNPLEIAWPDQNDYTDWISTATNTANSGRQLQGGSAFLAGAAVAQGVSLLWTDRATFMANYTGDNFVYATPMVSDNSGVIGPFAACTHGNSAYWMGTYDFWMWNGTVTNLPSDDIRDYVFTNINRLYANKCWAGVNRAKKEIWFSYPSSSSVEVDSYVIFHEDQACWSVGSWVNNGAGGTRTAWTDANLFPLPFAADMNGQLYQQEVGNDANGVALDSYITMSPADVSNGTQNMDMMGFIPDFERQSGNLALTINTRFYPEDPNTVDGPYTLTDNDTTPRIDLRSDGKMIGYELESNVIGGDFRVALVRADAQPSGFRR